MPHREGRLKEVYEQKTALSNSKTSIDAQLKTAKTSFVNLVHSESLKGDVKEAINAKITNHQVPLLTNFTNALAVLLAQYEKTIKQFQSTVSENAVDAIIDTEYLQGLLDGFSGLSMNISVVNRETERIYSSISDIISLTNPDASTITTPLSEGKKILTDTKTNMASSAVGSNLGRLAGAAIGQVVCPIPGVGAALGAVAGSIIGSAVGSWAGSAINKELDRNIKPKKQGWSWPW